ncbi:MAG: branched chain amino acid aminotransferase [Gammaproteobacteria bacterium]|nr:MAG: branched-chain amino acid transaminase [Pseudomonadota bacterium]MBC6943984.1 branched-chain amino acid transaminase [Gammaproteobacteria bacterium]MCE7895212.1 branched-chain amino acid transaminase [Gammaproteobacteria bacterium PRO8]MDL1880302.1 branched-chain amino acid transaminase [Gammaproteobacteria bacterium PRO2]MCQ3934120.1 branched chain amino acid aminotransferase [Gammaproteobacteria bacterium]
MPIKTSEWIWHNGKLVPWAEARVHVMTHALHYGSSVFEGIRVYATPRGAMVFRLQAHTRRLLESATIHRIEVPWSAAQIDAACREVVVRNGLTRGAYIRPIVFRGYGEVGLAPPPGQPIDMAVAAWEWGAYLGADALEQGVDVCVSSWQRVAPNTIPALAKAGGNYLSSTLVSLEAKQRGFAEGIALSSDGTVSEGAGENIFLVRDGVLYTPPSTASILTGITRDSVMVLARQAGIEVQERPIPREMLYIADEIFLTGTAAEITPVRSVDRINVGAGRRGPVTQRLQESFFGLFNGKTSDQWGWLEPVESK